MQFINRKQLKKKKKRKIIELSIYKQIKSDHSTTVSGRICHGDRKSELQD